MVERGGKRPGAGRPKGSKTTVVSIDQISMINRAQEMATAALDALLEIVKTSQNDGVRVKAACTILDRAFGRPTQMVIQKKEDTEGSFLDQFFADISSGKQHVAHPMFNPKRLKSEREENT